jgi:hypothetical protein
MTSDNEIYGTFSNLLWRDIQNTETFPAKRPLLAHYTSIANLECIMANDEVWFSNPLYMNDLEELRFVILEGAQAFRQDKAIKSACGNPERYNKLLHAFEYNLDQFSNKHAFDIYVFCLSEHESKITDGLLSMWRGYGGNGSGAAIVFDTAQLDYIEDSPLIIANVTYASQDKRREWINNKLATFADLIEKNYVPDDKLYLPAHALFERIKIYSIFTKHHGFSEEKEWRAVYLRERDLNHKMDGMLHYAVGKRGIEPKLKYKIRPIEGLTRGDLSLEKIVHHIILGPSVASPLAISAVQRMLEKVGKHALASKLVASTTPFRPV